MALTDRLLEKIDGLAKGRALSSAGIAKALGVMLQPAADQSTEFTLLYVGGSDPAQMFENVELRMPGPSSENRSQLLILTVNQHNCVKMDEVIHRYGAAELEVPTPREPPESPSYLVFRKPWGELSFGFARDAKACLGKIVIDVQAPTTG